MSEIIEVKHRLIFADLISFSALLRLGADIHISDNLGRNGFHVLAMITRIAWPRSSPLINILQEPDFMQQLQASNGLNNRGAWSRNCQHCRFFPE